MVPVPVINNFFTVINGFSVFFCGEYNQFNKKLVIIRNTEHWVYRYPTLHD